jgi:hypothetical protein
MPEVDAKLKVLMSESEVYGIDKIPLPASVLAKRSAENGLPNSGDVEQHEWFRIDTRRCTDCLGQINGLSAPKVV